MASNRYRKVIPAKPSSFQREKGVKPPARGILIVTEGQVSEPVYFEQIKHRLALPTVELHVAGAGIGDPKTLAIAALQEQKNRRKAARAGELGYAQVADFDEIWIVFDTDIPQQQGKLHDGLRFAESKKIQCAHSTPCFEYWLLLHLERTTAPMPTCEDVIPRLSKALRGKYSKDNDQSRTLIPPLIQQLQTAEKNAAWVRKYHRGGGTAFPYNPSTEVDQLIASIRAELPPAQQTIICACT